VYELKDELREFFAGVYEIEDEIKGGGMSRLFLATDATLHRKVVIKILPPDFSNEVTAARFKREAQLTAGLQHPHILPIISAGSAKDLLYYVMPYVDGESLRTRMAREGALPVNEAIRLLLEICDALAHAHANGVIHRDIKPENILLQGGHAVVADFGIAGALDGGNHPRMSGPTRLTSTGISLGTVGYMAPEQSVGERNIDTRADVYSLGVVGYEMIAGRRLFEGESAQTVIAAHLTQRPVPLDRTADGVPTPVVMAIEKALEKNPDDRFQTAGEFRDALRAQLSPMTTMTRAVPAALVRAAKRRAAVLRSRTWVAAALVFVAAVAGGAMWWKSRSSTAGAADVVRVAVVPFDVIGEEPIWKEGIVDLMARNLDGAGTLHTIAPAIVVRDWKGKSDRDNARATAQRLGADYAVFGSIIASTGETSRMTASLLNVRTDSIVGEFKGSGAEITHLADSLALVVIESLGRWHRLGAVDRPAPRGTSSVPALRYFLQGEQLFRRTQWDSAFATFRKSADADSMFALPLHRMSEIGGWLSFVSDSEPRALALRAGRLNRGLAPRDSLIVATDSLTAAASNSSGAINWALVPRLFQLLNRAVKTYPDDPEAWYLLGEARYHLGFGRTLGVTDAMVLDAFDKSIALDSAFGPAYAHTPELAFQLRGARAARNYAEAYLRREPTGQDAAAFRVLATIADEKQGLDAALRIADTLPWSDLERVFLYVRRWPDSTSAALRILETADRRPRNNKTMSADTMSLRMWLPLELAFRGRMSEAFTRTHSSPTLLLTELAYLEAIPADTASALFRSWAASGHPAVRSALAWFAERRDTLPILAFARRADSIAAKPDLAKDARTRANYTSAAASAYLALARADSGLAVRRFAALSDTSCLTCYLDRLVEARLLRAKGNVSRADTLLSQRIAVFLSPIEIPIALERAELAAAQGRSADAVRDLRFVIDTWGSGDESLQPYVRRARMGLSKIHGKTVASITAQP
jgi:serine/threonine-protein kinase